MARYCLFAFVLIVAGTSTPGIAGDAARPAAPRRVAARRGSVSVLQDNQLQRATRDLTPEQIKELERELLGNIDAIDSPAERVAALVGAARTLASGEGFDAADDALERAVGDLSVVSNRNDRNRLAMEFLAVTNYLVDGLKREATSERFQSETMEIPVVPADKRLAMLRRADVAVTRAVKAVRLMDHQSFAPDSLYRLVVIRAAISRDVAAKVAFAPETNPELVSAGAEVVNLCFQILASAREDAKSIPLAVIRDRALVEIVQAGASSGQYDAAFAIARELPVPETRADAFIKLGEGSSRHGTEKQTARAFQAAAETIACIQVSDLRSTLARVLIDSLIASGRFDDARACVVLLPNISQKMRVLGAVAESQAVRGLSKDAMEWIRREVKPEYRAQLIERVGKGTIENLDRNRSNELRSMFTASPRTASNPRASKPAKLSSAAPRPRY